MDQNLKTILYFNRHYLNGQNNWWQKVYARNITVHTLHHGSVLLSNLKIESNDFLIEENCSFPGKSYSWKNRHNSLLWDLEQHSTLDNKIITKEAVCTTVPEKTPQ